MQRIVTRKLPSGEIQNVQPYHISLKGLEKAILCRDDEDYGVLVKYIAVCAHRKKVIVIIYGVVSNHCHIAILAATYQDACKYAEELKRTYAQWIQIKYREKQGHPQSSVFRLMYICPLQGKVVPLQVWIRMQRN